MSLSEDAATLAGVPLFQGVDPARLKLIAFAAERQTVPAGTLLVRQGEAGDAVYVVLSGEASALVDAADGSTIRVGGVPAGTLFGEVALLADVPRTATVKADTEVAVLRLDADLFFDLVQEFPGVGIAVMRELARRLDRSTALLRDRR
ncbi:Crp/Fnr family transcriptional regulator [Zavarzinia compransoris]|uniref:Cyclic nucleotide-binding protein n=1 Tax=Zavarzinia compransoris TaxID=1264899 RepID=A0A317DVY3_9PROT|nr:Crp/Fnr family transcriptional regulator [Zavarzinia compransoris]PWR18867.1 cyclic nucleotide-binding protein [Zavarzinia compransoris]TDP48862.1 cyclic nucleotide-binding protein [Zavarzinia compransoris]